MKRVPVVDVDVGHEVAPLAGAWIETLMDRERSLMDRGRAPRGRAVSRTRGAGSVTWIATFADGGREYIAIGRNRNRMAVFRVDCALGVPIMERLAMTSPGRRRFVSLDRVSRPRRAGAADAGHRGVYGAHGCGEARVR